MQFFEWRGCQPAEDLADETMDRVSARLAEGVEIRLPDPARYVYGVARNVVREVLARASRAPRAVDVDLEGAIDPASCEPPAEDLDRALHCVDRCLESLPPETRQLVLLYHGGRGRVRLVEGLQLPAGTLRVRMHRLRKRLERCVRDCMDSGLAAGRGAGPVRYRPSQPGDEP